MAVISVKYSGGVIYDDEDNPVGNDTVYKSVKIFTSQGYLEFDSGDFVVDWYNAKKKYSDISVEEPFLAQSSSVDQFIWDSGRFDSAYLHMENDDGVLKYLDFEDPAYHETQREVYEDGWEFFVPAGTKPTWEELKNYVKEKTDGN